jgi:hypothetical protein
LSAAWEILDKQVKSKVFDLKAAEERVVKAGQDVSHTSMSHMGSTNAHIISVRSWRTSTSPLCARKMLSRMSARTWHATSRSRQKLWRSPCFRRRPYKPTWYVHGLHCHSFPKIDYWLGRPRQAGRRLRAGTSLIQRQGRFRARGGEQVAIPS